MRPLVQDALYGLRLLRKKPGFTVVAVGTLALGIATNTAIFSLVYATFLAPFPYRPVQAGDGLVAGRRRPDARRRPSETVGHRLRGLERADHEQREHSARIRPVPVRRSCDSLEPWGALLAGLSHRPVVRCGDHLSDLQAEACPGLAALPPRRAASRDVPAGATRAVRRAPWVPASRGRASAEGLPALWPRRARISLAQNVRSSSKVVVARAEVSTDRPATAAVVREDLPGLEERRFRGAAK